MKFHLGTILSITTGYLLAQEGDYPIDGVYNILNFMTDDNLSTHALPRACEECRPYLYEQLPFLHEITSEMVKERIEQGQIDGDVNIDAVLAPYVEKYGTMHEVRQIHGEDHEHIDPIEELKRLRPDLAEDGIISIILPDDNEPSDIGDINWKV